MGGNLPGVLQIECVRQIASQFEPSAQREALRGATPKSVASIPLASSIFRLEHNALGGNLSRCIFSRNSKANYIPRSGLNIVQAGDDLPFKSRILSMALVECFLLKDNVLSV
ncbi:MAG: hypothetical protein RL336_421 [Pseudomonadota bacterium]